ncbi:Bug family tripartite tricarboxylate transporter substrate binding protein [Caenimonas sedimenti]|nr:tripartite tricarboxylate transporter substrate-binding protein [Caenimonas sedimenti]
MDRRKFLAAGCATVVPPASLAQDWPNRPIKFVVPFPPGGAADTVARELASRLQVSLGVACLVDNRPGASGTIGVDAVVNSPADGYTLLSHVSSIVIQPHLAAARHNVLAELAPITQTVAGSYVLVAHPTFPASDLQSFVAVVKRSPGRYSYASFGSGSGPHLAMELLKGHAGLFIVHVPFRGAGPALQELLTGRLDMAFETTFAALPHIRAGRLKPIALGGLYPSDALPGVQTIATSISGFDTDGWQGMFAPRATPAPVVSRLAEHLTRALRDREFTQRNSDLGFRTIGSSPANFATFVRSEYEKWGQVIRERGIRPD